MDIHIVNGWALFQHELMAEILLDLEGKVEALVQRFEEENDDKKIIEHPLIKLYEAIINNIYNKIPEDPQHKNYLLGNTLANTNALKKILKSESRAFLRLKNQGLPSRYRLFFRFNSTAPRSIIYIWMNNKLTQRKEGSKTDVYTVFARMLNKGDIPISYEELLKQSQPINESNL